MTAITIRAARPADAARLDGALRALSAAMGDTHGADLAELLRAGFGPVPAFHALLAEAGDGLVGATIYSPLFSTTRGGAGAYVSDLWVADGQRGHGLGPRLLAAVRDRARDDWGARFLRLGVYADNRRALAFYARLGFAPMQGDLWLTLEGSALDALGDPR